MRTPSSFIPGESSGAGGLTSSLSNPNTARKWRPSSHSTIGLVAFLRSRTSTGRSAKTLGSPSEGRHASSRRAEAEVTRSLHARSTNPFARHEAGSSHVVVTVRASKPFDPPDVAARGARRTWQVFGVLPCR